MGYFEVLPHQHLHQGWIGEVKHRGQAPVLRGGIGEYNEAMARAAEHGVRLRIPIAVREQMDAADCGPAAWPDELAQ